MADRTSACLFAQLFEMLAENEEVSRDKIADFLWEEMRNYDFNIYQMGCDEALIKLGLARVNSESEIVYKDGQSY